MSVAAAAGARVAAVAAACALLAAITALAISAGPMPRGSRAEAADCAWHRHAKRVVKHVRRYGGRRRRVVRSRNRWTCEESQSSDAVVSLPPAAPAPPQPEPEANVVGVTADDEQPEHFGYTLSRPSTRSGQVRVELNNLGEDPHNLNPQRQGSEGETVYQLASTLPKEHRSASFDLPPGTYRLWCSLLEHDAEEMHAALIVE